MNGMSEKSLMFFDISREDNTKEAVNMKKGFNKDDILTIFCTIRYCENEIVGTFVDDTTISIDEDKNLTSDRCGIAFMLCGAYSKDSDISQMIINSIYSIAERGEGHILAVSFGKAGACKMVYDGMTFVDWIKPQQLPPRRNEV